MDFILMLTNRDRTVSDALEALTAVRSTGLAHVGFKDVGTTPEQQRALTGAAHAANMTVYLEVVSTPAESALRSVQTGIDAGVDWVLGAMFPGQTLEVLRGTTVNYAPFPGRIVGHPSVLEGSIEEIAADAATFSSLDGVSGINLLAYRHRTVDSLALAAAVVASSRCPVIAAGSITGENQIRDLTRVGVVAFTIGGAVFDGHIPGDTLADRVATVLKWTNRSRSLRDSRPLPR